MDGRVIVPYTISDSFPNSDKEIIRMALDELEAKTGCIKFIKRTIKDKNYIKVIRSRTQTTLCSSNIGIVGGEQKIILGTYCMKKGIIQHEFIHALGFRHEHTRPDRDDYVTYVPQNLISVSKANNFSIDTRSETLGSPYDYNSIMHYGATAFGEKENGVTATTLVTKNGQRIGNRVEATVNDIKKLKLLYQCENGPRNWVSLEQSPCTSSCRCKSGEIGCGSDNNACQGSLVCSNDKCSVGAAPTPSPPSPPTPSRQKNLIYNKYQDDGRTYCIDLFARDIRNGNKVWYYPCNYTPGKKQQHLALYVIRATVYLNNTNVLSNSFLSVHSPVLV
jgi:hypothetical protein